MDLRRAQDVMSWSIGNEIGFGFGSRGFGFGFGKTKQNTICTCLVLVERLQKYNWIKSNYRAPYGEIYF